MAEEVRKSIEAEAAEVEEGSGGQQGTSNGASEQQAVTNGMAMLELVRLTHLFSHLEALALAFDFFNLLVGRF